MARIKSSQLAGSWYAGSTTQLLQQVDALLQAAGPPAITAPLRALVVPHAGYIYSGRAAAAAYACLRGADVQRAVILAPSHYDRFRGAAVLDVDAFETPLGLVAVDGGGVATLAEQPLFRETAQPFRDEHSLEIQLPFLQRVLPAVRVVPALIGDLMPDDDASLATAFRRLADDHTLFIVSSDFVHYGARFGYLPFPSAGAEPVRAALQALDMGAIEHVCAGDAAAFRQYVGDTDATICGRMPIAVFLTMHQRRSAGRLLAYYTSLDVTGDYEHCVSYASIVFPRM